MHLRIIPALLVLTLLCGCKIDLPAFDAASVELHENGQVTRGALSKIQADALADWVRTHRTGWEFRIEDAPLDGLLVFFKRRGVTVAVVGVRQREIVIRGRVKAIAPDERAVLYTILASFITGKKEANKAPEPTPGSVTARAPTVACDFERRDAARAAPAPVVAHL